MMTGREKKPALKVEQLSVNYDKTPVLWDVHCEIPEGKLVGIVGPNGAGKSTFLKTLLGMTRPLSGRIEFFGHPYKKVRHRIAYVPQRSSVDWDFPVTAYEVVLMGRYGKLGFLKWPKAADRQAAERALEMVGMLPFAERQISQLSGGQQQRLFIARALLQDADLYLMDEPFAGVDMATEKAIISLMDKLKVQGKTLLVVHHDLSTVDSYFDWVVMLNTCLIANGPVSEVFNSDSIMRTYGRSSALLDEAAKLTQNKTSGLQ
ncbi:MAG: metal ABC transporter ATP-binding protein [Verrucomicrobia bacterium]|nr:metal ABC transporter ATP-binding protein [Verrucomicrobiota bacterium]